MARTAAQIAAQKKAAAASAKARKAKAGSTSGKPKVKKFNGMDAKQYAAYRASKGKAPVAKSAEMPITRGVNSGKRQSQVPSAPGARRYPTGESSSKSTASSKSHPQRAHDAPGKPNYAFKGTGAVPMVGGGKKASSNVTVKMTTYAKHRMAGSPLKQAKAFQSGGRYGTIIQSKSKGAKYDRETRRAKK